MRSRSTSLAAISAALALGACSSGAGVAPPPPPPAPIPVTGALRVHDASGATGPFRLADLQRLVVDSTYSGLPGPHALRVDVVRPGGDLYVQLPADVTAGADGAAAASQRLEVRGTPMHTYHLVGSWRFVLTADGAQLASAQVDVVD